jgi:hypothetical protein
MKLCIQILQLRVVVGHAAPDASFRPLRRLLRHWQKRRTMGARYQIHWPAPNRHIMPHRRLELPKEARPHRRPPTFFGIGASSSTWKSQGAVPTFYGLLNSSVSTLADIPKPSKTWNVSIVIRGFNLGQEIHISLKFSRPDNHGTRHSTPELEPPNHVLGVGFPATVEPSCPEPREWYRFGDRDAAAAGS